MAKRTKRAACTIGLSGIEKAVAEFAALSHRQQLALLRKRAVGLRRKKGWNLTQAEVIWIDLIDELPDDPGEGHPCRPLWAFYILQVYEMDVAAAALARCLAENPVPPPPIEV